MVKKIEYNGAKITIRKMTYANGTEGIIVEAYNSSVAFHNDRSVHVIICGRSTVSVEMEKD